MPTVDLTLPDRYAGPERIGYGGMGEILRAHDRRLGRDVAIKVLADRYSHDPELRARFTHEALTAAKLSWHPNVVTIFDVGEADGRPYIVMELLEGGTLADRLERGDVDTSAALGWLEEAAQALDAAHSAGIVHRDVKPANLLLDARGCVHVADFGIARVVDESASGMTAAGTVLGTAGYLSPEQAMGAHVTAASDNYSLAVVAFELLTGSRPFRRQSSMAEAAAHVNEPAPAASRRNPHLPPTVDGVLHRALAKQPERRHRSAGDMVAALRGAFERAERAERTTRRMAPAAVRVPPASAASARSHTTVRGAPGRLRTVVPIAAALLVLLAISAMAAQSLVGGPRAETAAKPRARAAGSARSAAAPGSASRATDAAQARRLNDQAYALMNQGRYAEALPLLQRALPALSGVAPTEAFANFNLGSTLLGLGRCAEAIPFLGRSAQLQGMRPEIATALRRAQACGRVRRGGSGNFGGNGGGNGGD